MDSFWFAECIPCKWQTKHTVQDDAIRAAEDHVIEKHRDVPPPERGKRFIGHVQNRSENAIGTVNPVQVELPPGAVSTPENVNEVPEVQWGTELAPTKPA